MDVMGCGGSTTVGKASNSVQEEVSKVVEAGKRWQ